MTPPGVGANLVVSFSIAGQATIISGNSNDLPTRYSYRAPSISSVSPTYAFLVALGVVQEASFSFSGRDFGLNSGSVLYASVGGVNCSSISVSADTSQLTCSGVRANMWNASALAADIVVNVAGQIVTSSSAINFIGSPIISSIDPILGTENSLLTVRGFNFGRIGSDVLSVKVGGVEVRLTNTCVPLSTRPYDQHHATSLLLPIARTYAA